MYPKFSLQQGVFLPSAGFYHCTLGLVGIQIHVSPLLFLNHWVQFQQLNNVTHKVRQCLINLNTTERLTYLAFVNDDSE